MILIANVCFERLHYYEFVKPIEDIVGEDFVTRHYSEISEEDLSRADKVIICGTSLKDEDYLSGDFSWLRNFEKPVLGICAGMQIIGMVFGGELKKKTEVGFYFENVDKDFLGLSGEVEVYHLHNSYVEFSEDFDIFAGEDVSQAVRHKVKSVYGVLFHPEVRQKEMILEFVKNG